MTNESHTQDPSPQDPASQDLPLPGVPVPEFINAYLEQEIHRHGHKVASYTKSIDAHDAIFERAPDDLGRAVTRCMTEVLMLRRSEHELVRDILKEIRATEGEQSRATALAAITTMTMVIGP